MSEISSRYIIKKALESGYKPSEYILAKQAEIARQNRIKRELQNGVRENVKRATPKSDPKHVNQEGVYQR